MLSAFICVRFTPRGANTPQGWFIFTFLLWIATLRSTLAFSSLLFTVWMTFLLLGIGYLDNDGAAVAAPNHNLNLAGGAFGIIAAFLAWWNMMAGLLDRSNVSSLLVEMIVLQLANNICAELLPSPRLPLSLVCKGQGAEVEAAGQRRGRCA